MLMFKRMLNVGALVVTGLAINACSGGGGGGGSKGAPAQPGPSGPGKIPTFPQIDASRCLSEKIRDGRETDFPGFRGFDDESPQKRLAKYIDQSDASCVKAVLSRGARANEITQIENWPNGTIPMYPIFAALRKNTLWKDRNEIGVLRALVEGGADVNVKNNQGQTPLQVALSSEILKEYANASAYLISTKKCDLEHKDPQGLTPIWIAMNAGAIETVFQLINHGANVLVQHPQGENLLQVALIRGAEAQNLAVTLIGKGVDPMASNRNGDNSLHMAARNKQIDVANAILAKNVNVNAQNNQRETALVLAIRFGSNPIALALLNKNADVNLASDTSTALHLALDANNNEVALAILPKVTNVNSLDSSKQTALLIATRRSSAGLVKAILDRGGNAKIGDQHGITPLMYALGDQQSDKVGELLSKSDVNQKALDGRTAIFFAKNVTDMLNLVNNRADINAKANNGATVLSNAITSNNSDVAVFAIERGADTSYKNIDGDTLLHSSIFNNQLTVARALLERRIEANVKNVKGETPIFGARNVPAVNLLVEYKANINQTTPDGRSVISQLVSSHLGGFGGSTWAFDVIKRLVELHVNVEVKSEKGVPLLQEVAGAQDLSFDGIKARDESKLLSLLLDGGAKVNGVDAKRNTALHAADMPNEVGLLLNRGADRNLKNSDQHTALLINQAKKHVLETVVADAQKDLDKVISDLSGLTPGSARHNQLTRRKLEIEAKLKAYSHSVDQLNKIIVQLQ